MDLTQGPNYYEEAHLKGQVIHFLSDGNLCSPSWTWLCSLLPSLSRAAQTVGTAERNGCGDGERPSPLLFIYPPPFPPLLFFPAIDISHHAHTARISIHSPSRGDHKGEGEKEREEREERRRGREQQSRGIQWVTESGRSFNSPLVQTQFRVSCYLCG